MSNERKEHRLLPFRARRRLMHPIPEETGADAVRADDELNELLRSWEAPPPSATARTRIVAAFREQAAPPTLWRRMLTASVRIPAPVAAAVLVALAGLCAALAMRSTHVVALEAPPAYDAAPAPARIVEVLVPQERVVTRVVYLEKKSGGQSRRDERPPQPQAHEQVARESAQEATPARGATTTQEAANGYFTGVNMSEFQPSDEMKIRIIKKGDAR
jgi:hypothetical protein